MALPKIYTDENAARAHLEALLWPDGPVCPRCQSQEVTKLKGKSTRPGVYKCRPCQKPFSVTVGTVFERSHIPLHQWVYATHLLTSSKKGISAHQLMRMLHVTYKTAWFMAHRIREAMRPTEFSPMGGSGGPPVESDETFIGRREGVIGRNKHQGTGHKNVVLTLVERGGPARSFHINTASVDTIVPILRTNISRESRLMTDGARIYTNVGKEFAEHSTVDHAIDEYVRGDIHTNTVEGYYSIFKRGMKGIYQHCAEKHLHRYLSEFDFRYTNRIARGIGDATRARKALEGIKGKRLTYRRPN